jgi:hypothetical protein
LGLKLCPQNRVKASKKRYRKYHVDNEEIPRMLKLKKGGSTNFIQKAIKKPGAPRAKKGEPIPAKKLAAAVKKPGKLGQRARFR